MMQTMKRKKKKKKEAPLLQEIKSCKKIVLIETALGLWRYILHFYLIFFFLFLAPCTSVALSPLP